MNAAVYVFNINWFAVVIIALGALAIQAVKDHYAEKREKAFRVELHQNELKFRDELGRNHYTYTDEAIRELRDELNLPAKEQS